MIWCVDVLNLLSNHTNIYIHTHCTKHAIANMQYIRTFFHGASSSYCMLAGLVQYPHLEFENIKMRNMKYLHFFPPKTK